MSTEPSHKTHHFSQNNARKKIPVWLTRRSTTLPTTNTQKMQKKTHDKIALHDNTQKVSLAMIKLRPQPPKKSSRPILTPQQFTPNPNSSRPNGPSTAFPKTNLPAPLANPLHSLEMLPHERNDFFAHLVVQIIHILGVEKKGTFRR